MIIAQQPCRKPSFYYAFRGSAALKVSWDHFLLKGGHQNRAGGQSLWKVVKSFQWFFISTEDSVLFSLTNLSQQTQWNLCRYRVLGENVTWLDYFSLVFFLSCVHVSPIKTKIGGRTNIFTRMRLWKTSYILLKREEPIKAF